MAVFECAAQTTGIKGAVFDGVSLGDKQGTFVIDVVSHRRLLSMMAPGDVALSPDGKKLGAYNGTSLLLFDVPGTQPHRSLAE